MAEIPILVEEEERARPGTLGATRGREQNAIKTISTEKLRESLTALSGEFATIMRDVKEVGGFKLKEVQIQAGIDAQAGIVLLGKAGLKGSVTLTFSNE